MWHCRPFILAKRIMSTHLYTFLVNSMWYEISMSKNKTASKWPCLHIYVLYALYAMSPHREEFPWATFEIQFTYFLMWNIVNLITCGKENTKRTTSNVVWLLRPSFQKKPHKNDCYIYLNRAYVLVLSPLQ